MARGDMLVKEITFGSNVDILNRPTYDAVPMTLDFTGVANTTADGRKVIKAGTPIDGSGAPITGTPWTGAVGILLVDVTEDYPTGAVIKGNAYVNVTKAQSNSGLTYDAALVNALINAGCSITFENPNVIGTLA